MINSLGTRLTDPKSKPEIILKEFRANEDKEKIEVILKARVHTLSSSKNSSNSSGCGSKSLLTGGGGSGRGSISGGRGFSAGRGGVSTGRGAPTGRGITTGGRGVTASGRGVTTGGRGAPTGRGAGKPFIGKRVSLIKEGDESESESDEETDSKEEEIKPSVTEVVEVVKPHVPPVVEVAIKSPVIVEEVVKHFVVPEVIDPPIVNISIVTEVVEEKEEWEKKRDIESILEAEYLSNKSSVKEVVNSVVVEKENNNLQSTSVEFVEEKEEWEKKSDKEAILEAVEVQKMEKINDQIESVIQIVGLSVSELDNVTSGGMESWETKAVKNNLEENENIVESKNKIIVEKIEEKKVEKSELYSNEDVFTCNPPSLSEKKFVETKINIPVVKSKRRLSSVLLQTEVESVSINSNDDTSDSSINPAANMLRRASVRSGEVGVNTIKQFFSKNMTPKTQNKSTYLIDNHNTSTTKSKTMRRPSVLTNKPLISKEGLRESLVLGIDQDSFFNLVKEGPVGEKDGLNQYSYQELVRRNYEKEFDDIDSQTIEKYLIDKDFDIKFGMTKELFFVLPQWRRHNLKKGLLLF
jgi:hypothetical protein